MTTPPAVDAAPASLKPRGAALWRRLTGALTFDPHEAELLERACHLADRLDDLDAAVQRDGVMIAGARGSQRLHPAIAEHRATTLALARVLVALRIPAGYADQQGPAAAPTRQAQRRTGVRGVYSVPRGA